MLQPRLIYLPIAAASPVFSSLLYSVMLPMNGPERRQTPRTTVEKFVYINIEPSNGGNVLNVSEGGICFHSIAPVQMDRTITVWFSEHNRRIKIEGELAWMDEARKTGGLRFTSLPAEAREPIRNWMAPPVITPAADEVSARLLPPWRAFAGASARPAETNTEPSCFQDVRGDFSKNKSTAAIERILGWLSDWTSGFGCSDSRVPVSWLSPSVR